MSFINMRNVNIYDKRKDGATLSKLADEYGLSVERIRQICIKLERIDNTPYGNRTIYAVRNGLSMPSRPVVKDQSEATAHDYIMALIPDAPENVVVRAVNCVCRKFAKEYSGLYKDPPKFIKLLSGMTEDELMTMRNCGRKTYELLVKVRENSEF